MVNGTLTGPDIEAEVPIDPIDTGFDINHPLYNAEALAATVRAAQAPAVLPTTAPAAPLVNLRLKPVPQLATAAPRHPHNAPISVSPRSTPYVAPVVPSVPAVPRTTISGLPVPS